MSRACMYWNACASQPLQSNSIDLTSSGYESAFKALHDTELVRKVILFQLLGGG